MAYAERRDDLITVTTKYTEKELIKQVPGALWDDRNKIWTVPLTWAACLQLRGIFMTDLQVGADLTAWSWNEYQRRVKPATELRTVIEGVNGYDERLYDFQAAGAEFLRVGESGLLADDLGMGKTAQILAVLDALQALNAHDTLPALVICPNSVKTGWEKQVKMWNVNVVPYVVTGGAAERRKIIERARHDPYALVIINVESVRLFSRLAPFGSTRLTRCRQCDKKYGEEKITSTRCEVHRKELNGFGFKTVILDEAHRCKEPQSKQTRAVWAVGHDPSVRRRWALTGTPIANHVGDLWAIMHFIVPDEYPNKSKFVDRYGLQSWNAFGGLDLIGINPVTRDEFFSIFDARFRRTPKLLVLDQLPPVVRATRWVDMVPKQRKAYDELERRLATRLDNGQVLISRNNLVNATRLLQLSSSYCDAEWIIQPLTVLSKCKCYGAGYDQHGPECPEGVKVIVTLTEPSTKLDAMEEAYDELGGKPVIVAAESRQLIELAAKRFHKMKVPYGMITGVVKDYERQQVIERFQGNHLNVILMTIKAGGTGVDGLQHADTMFCLQRSWSMIDNVQLDGRVDRIGSEKHNSVTIVDFITRNTIEESTQYPRLAEKQERLEEINRDRVRLVKAGIETSPTIYALDEEESRILASNLGEPTIFDDDDGRVIS